MSMGLSVCRPWASCSSALAAASPLGLHHDADRRGAGPAMGSAVGSASRLAGSGCRRLADCLCDGRQVLAQDMEWLLVAVALTCVMPVLWQAPVLPSPL